MMRVRSALRVGLAVYSALLFGLCLSGTMGWLPETDQQRNSQREEIRGQLALHLSQLDPELQRATIENALSAACRRYAELSSAAVWSANGQLVTHVGNVLLDHEPQTSGSAARDTADLLLYTGEALWGRVRLRFRPLASGAASRVFATLTSPLLMLPTVAVLLGGFYYLNVGPASGVVQGNALGHGRLSPHDGGRRREGDRRRPRTPGLEFDEVVDASVFAWEDRDAPEDRTQILEQLLQRLEESRQEVHRQNEELKSLASLDSLTSCLNRRSFFEHFETHWNTARRYDQPLSCVMIDVDLFKSINDAHGHQVGDRVLRDLAEELKASLRASDLLCRYGGEEFCVLMPHVDVEESLVAAKRLRRRIERKRCADLHVTISLGVSSRRFGASNPQELIAQADQALYAAKRSGRNRVVCWNDFPDLEEAVPDALSDSVGRDLEANSPNPIPYPAVTSLITALAHRDAATAAHSRRVADLCVAMAQGMMSERDCYVLETAALLHDIGKLGVPDAILLKPGPLTDEEWRIMQTHDEMGVDIIRSAFNSPELQEIVAKQHAWYGGNPQEPHLPSGFDIPMGARFLAVADAFDAMVSDRVFRQSRTVDEAMDELQRSSPEQFDPQIVERLEAVIADQHNRHDTDISHVSKQTALKIGLQIEKLATALDKEDIPTLAAMAACLGTTAAESGIPQIAEVATWLEQSAASAIDPYEIAQLTAELLELCRATQSSYLAHIDQDDDELFPQTAAGNNAGSDAAFPTI